MVSWVRGKCIGKGAFGTVNIAHDKLDGRVFAVKSVDLKTGLPGQHEALENEIRILQRMSSPHVVTFLGDDVTCQHRNLHMEYLPGGTLADLEADVDDQVVRRYTRCLVNALRHVHANGVVHCDVKGRNVLVERNGYNCKLADFGSAVEFSGDGNTAATRGSPLWMAPEVIRREYQGPESDVWSLGCTVIEMHTGKPPAWEGNGVEALSRIGYSGELPRFPTRLSELGRDFLEKCLRREPWRRWNCDQLLQHPFLLQCSTNEFGESSPRCVLDRFDSVSAEFDYEEEEIVVETENSARERIGKLAMSLRANWELEGWVTVRSLESTATVAVDGGSGSCYGHEGEGTWREYLKITRVEEEIEIGTSWEYLCRESERAKPEMWIRRCNSESECKRNESVASWSYRYGSGYRCENVDCFKGTIIPSIYSLCCNNLLKLHCLFLEYLNLYFCFWVIYIDYFIFASDMWGNNEFFEDNNRMCLLLKNDNHRLYNHRAFSIRFDLRWHGMVWPDVELAAPSTPHASVEPRQ